MRSIIWGGLTSSKEGTKVIFFIQGVRQVSTPSKLKCKEGIKSGSNRQLSCALKTMIKGR